MTVHVEFSQELLDLLGRLTANQRRAVPRIVATVAEGGTLTSLLQGPGKVCAWKTYYNAHNGWAHQPAFRSALERATQEYQQALLDQAVQGAAERIRRASLTAAELTEAVALAVLTGDAARVPPSVQRLLDLQRGADTPGQQIQAASVLLNQGLRAALTILDRADIATAVKAAGTEEARWRSLLDELRGGDDEVADVEPEAEGIQSAGVSSSPGPDGSSPEPGAGDPGSGS